MYLHGNKMKLKEMKGHAIDEMREIKLYFLVMSFHFLKMSFRLLPSPFHFNSFLPLTSVISHLLSFPRSTQDLSFPSSQLFHFLLILFISSPFKCIRLLDLGCYFFQMIEPSEMMRVSEQNYGPKTIPII